MDNFYQFASLGLNTSSQVGSLFEGSPGVNQRVFGEAAAGAGLASMGIGATLGVNALAHGTTVTAAAAAAGGKGVIGVLSSIGPWAALAIPVFILLSKIFKGADPRQVPAARIEQVFEAASIHVQRLTEVGMISKPEAAGLFDALLQKGNEYYDDPSVVLGVAEVKGWANMAAVIRAVTSQTAAFADRPLISADLAKARTLYLPARDARTWYPESLAAASQLTDQIVQSIPARSVGDAVGQAAAAIKSDPWKLVGLGVGAFSLVGLLRRFL